MRGWAGQGGGNQVEVCKTQELGTPVSTAILQQRVIFLGIPCRIFGSGSQQVCSINIHAGVHIHAVGVKVLSLLLWLLHYQDQFSKDFQLVSLSGDIKMY